MKFFVIFVILSSSVVYSENSFFNRTDRGGDISITNEANVRLKRSSWRDQLVEDIDYFVWKKWYLDNTAFVDELHDVVRKENPSKKFLVGSYNGDTQGWDEHYYNSYKNVVHKFRDRGHCWFVAYTSHSDATDTDLSNYVEECIARKSDYRKLLLGRDCRDVNKVVECIQNTGQRASIICVKHGNGLRTSSDRTPNFYKLMNLELWLRIGPHSGWATQKVSLIAAKDV